MQAGAVRQKFSKLKEELETAKKKEALLEAKLATVKAKQRDAQELTEEFNKTINDIGDKIDQADQEDAILEKKAKERSDEADELHRQFRVHTQAAEHAQKTTKGRLGSNIEKKLAAALTAVDTGTRTINELSEKAKQLEEKVIDAELRSSKAALKVKSNNQKLTSLIEDLNSKERGRSHSKAYTEKLLNRLTSLETKFSSTMERADKAEKRAALLDEKVEKAYEERDQWKKDFASTAAELAHIRAELAEFCG